MGKERSMSVSFVGHQLADTHRDDFSGACCLMFMPGGASKEGQEQGSEVQRLPLGQRPWEKLSQTPLLSKHLFSANTSVCSRTKYIWKNLSQSARKD